MLLTELGAIKWHSAWIPFTVSVNTRISELILLKKEDFLKSSEGLTAKFSFLL